MSVLIAVVVGIGVFHLVRSLILAGVLVYEMGLADALLVARTQGLESIRAALQEEGWIRPAADPPPIVPPIQSREEWMSRARALLARDDL